MKTETTTRSPAGSQRPRPGPSAESIRRGAIVGRYTVLGAIGSGGMGNVFAAWDPELERRVAIKALHGDLRLSASSKKAQERLRKEAQAAAQLAHPNVVAIYDVGTFGEALFIAMELLEGQTLRRWSMTPRPWRETVAVYRQAGRGLAAAHQVGLVHRDVKPGNVMLADDGQVKILDFGLARGFRGDRSPADRPPGPTVSGADAPWTQDLGGTPRYMSPEQARGEPLDHRSDQFSFCVSLYQALYRDLPFAGESDEERHRALLAAQRRPVPSKAKVPARIHRVLERGLEADPEARYPTMDALLDDLRAATSVRRRTGAVVAVLLTAVAAMVFVPRDEAVVCDAAGRGLEDVWNDNRRDRVAAAFAAAEASASWPRVARAVDAKVVALRSMYVDTCQATHVRGEQSAEVLDRRVACLDDRRREADALMRLFERGQPEVLPAAASAVENLPDLAACADRRTLTDVRPLRPPDAALAEVEAVRDRLADAQALELAGRYAEAHEVSGPALAASERAGYRPLVGEAHLQHARVVGRLGDSGGMKAHLIDSASIALETQHRALLAEAYLQLIVVGFLRGELDEAHAHGKLAAAAISTLSGRQDLEAQRLFFLGMIALREGDFVRGRDLYERYLSLDPRLVKNGEMVAYNNLAEAHRELGDLERAEETLLRAVRLLDTLDPGHELRPGILASLGELYLAMGDLERAEPYLFDSLEGLEAALGPSHPKVANFLPAHGHFYLASERYAEAIAVLERAAAIHRARPGYDVKPAERAWLLGRALWEQGADRRRALALIRDVAASRAGPGETAVAEQAAAWLRARGEG